MGTSPSSRRILKLRLLILSVGELGKQLRQLPREDMISRSTCAMVANWRFDGSSAWGFGDAVGEVVPIQDDMRQLLRR